MRFALVDQTNGASTANGGKLTPLLLAQLAGAITVQLNVEFAAEWGGVYSCRAIDTVTELEEGEYPFIFLPSFADAAGAIAYHTTSGNGMPLLYDAITASDTLNGAGNSLTVAASHEVLETAADPACNRVVQLGDGSEIALEVCDPVENEAYASEDGIWLSNFVLQSWFCPGSSGPYSYMSRARMAGAVDAPAPLTVPPGRGYTIVSTWDPSSQHSVFGRRVDVRGCTDRRGFRAGSRRHRRGVQT